MSSDRSGEEMRRYTEEKHPGWLTIDYEDPLRSSFKAKYGYFAGAEIREFPGVERKGGIPSLVVVTREGVVVDGNAERRLNEYGGDGVLPWTVEGL